MEYEIHKFLDNGTIIYPATTSSAVIHPQVEKPITQMFNTYYMPGLFPGEVEDDIWTLNTAIAYLDQKLDISCKVPGTKISFLDNGEVREFEYFFSEYSFSQLGAWKETGLSLLTELESEVFPVTVTFSARPNIIEVGESASIGLSWGTYRKGTNVTLQSTNTIDGNTVSGISMTSPLTLSTKTTKTFAYSSTYQGITKTANASVKSAYRTYYGVVNDDWVPENGDGFKTTLTNSEVIGSKKMDWTGINLSNKCTAYAYDSSYGNLTSIKDSNNFEYLDSYEKYTIEDSDSVEYYIYVLKDPTTIIGFKQSFN